MWWKRDRKTDLFASVAMFGTAPSGGAANAGGPGGLGGPGAAPGGGGSGGGGSQRGEAVSRGQSGAAQQDPSAETGRGLGETSQIGQGFGSAGSDIRSRSVAETAQAFAEQQDQNNRQNIQQTYNNLLNMRTPPVNTDVFDSVVNASHLNAMANPEAAAAIGSIASAMPGNIGSLASVAEIVNSLDPKSPNTGLTGYAAEQLGLSEPLDAATVANMQASVQDAVNNAGSSVNSIGVTGDDPRDLPQFGGAGATSSTNTVTGNSASQSAGEDMATNRTQGNQDFGVNEALNRRLADVTGYSGDFGGGRFGNAFESMGRGSQIATVRTLQNRGRSNLASEYRERAGINPNLSLQRTEEEDQGPTVSDIAPQGFAQNRIGSSFGSDAVDEILNSQFQDARNVVENAGAREQLSDQGFNDALQSLDEQRSVAQARLGEERRSLADSVRQRLRNTRNEFQGSDNFDPEQFRSQLQGVEQDARSNIGGQLRSRIGEENLFNPNEAVTQGGIAQGQSNPGRSAVAGALQNRNRRRNSRNEERGLGTQGAF